MISGKPSPKDILASGHFYLVVIFSCVRETIVSVIALTARNQFHRFEGDPRDTAFTRQVVINASVDKTHTLGEAHFNQSDLSIGNPIRAFFLHLTKTNQFLDKNS